jgi:hypothetical protein
VDKADGAEEGEGLEEAARDGPDRLEGNEAARLPEAPQLVVHRVAEQLGDDAEVPFVVEILVQLHAVALRRGVVGLSGVGKGRRGGNGRRAQREMYGVRDAACPISTG